MLKDQLSIDMKAALKAGDKTRLSTLRFALSKMRECDDDASVLLVLKQLVKSHQDAQQQFIDADRKDLADGEAASLACLQAYLPEALSDAALLEHIDAHIASLGATGIKDMGQVMKALQHSVGMQCDMKIASQKVRERLSNLSG